MSTSTDDMVDILKCAIEFILEDTDITLDDIAQLKAWELEMAIELAFDFHEGSVEIGDKHRDPRKDIMIGTIMKRFDDSKNTGA